MGFRTFLFRFSSVIPFPIGVPLCCEEGLIESIYVEDDDVFTPNRSLREEETFPNIPPRKDRFPSRCKGIKSNPKVVPISRYFSSNTAPQRG